MRINTIRNTIAKAVTAAAALAIPAAASAASSNAINLLRNSVDNAGTKAGFTSQDLPTIIGNLIQQAMALLGIVLVVLVIYAGFLWMTAQGSEEKIKKAKGIISSAVIGLVLIFAAYSITGFVVKALYDAGV